MHNKAIFLYSLFAVCCVISPAFARAQVTIQGHVTDARTGSPLPAVNIWVKSTYHGTITNSQGRYLLTIKKLPAEVVFRYIGYRSVTIRVTATTPPQVNVKLEPVTLRMGEVVVTGKDPAEDIMRKVIEHKLQWEKKLDTYSADAYTRQVMANDTGIVSVMESLSRVFWNKKKGSREVILSKRQTSNIKSTQNFAASSYIPNFYDNNIDIAGYKMVGPTNPKALSYYNFTLKGSRYQDNNLIYVIHVQPKRKLQPTFSGTVSIMYKDYAMVAVNLQPGKSVFFPPPIRDVKLHYEQQFYNFGKNFWLPVDFRVNGMVKVSMLGLDFPPFKFSQLSKLTNYKVNAPLPDSLYQQKKLLLVDSLTVNNDSLFIKSKEVVPLSGKEKIAYKTIDSTDTFMKVFKPKGFLARYIKTDVNGNSNGGKSNSKPAHHGPLDKLTSNVTPLLWYNRVDAAHLGLKLSHHLGKRTDFDIKGGYNTGLHRYSYGGGLTFKFGKKRNGAIHFRYATGTQTQYKSDLYNMTETSVLPLVGSYDYFNYFWNDAFHSSVSYRISKLHSTFAIGFEDAHQTSLSRTTSYDLLGRNVTQRINPSINNGWMRSVSFTYTYGDNGFDPLLPITGQKHIVLHIEHSSPGLFDSNFDFNRYQFSVYWQFKTFYQRRFLPNVLDVKLVGGTYSGKLPLQRFGILDNALGPFTPFGSFKTVRSNPLVGESYLGLYWEHNFRTIPFQLIGLNGLARRGLGIILFGADGRTWISKSRLAELRKLYDPRYYDGFQNEIGLSLNGIFGIFRLDVAKNLNRPSVYFGVSVARIF